MLTSRDVLVISVCLITIHSALSCDYDTPTRRASCASFHSLKAAGQQPDWWRLSVSNPVKNILSLSSIKKDSFINVPNLIDIKVHCVANGIEKDAFNGLAKLFELHLEDNKIETLQSYAFGFITIERLYIYNSGLKTIQPNAFEGLSKLKILEIYGNHISKIEAGVFTGLNIEYLKLRKNSINHVDDNAFGNMDQLYWLSLEENELASFEPQLAIGYNAKLENLLINRNKLTVINRGMFTGFPNMLVLLLNINSIVRLDDYSFYDMLRLRLLDLSNNQLEEVQTDVFSPHGMQNLNLLFLHDNQMSFLSTGVLARMPKLEKISVGGNPWQCPCWRLLDIFMANHNMTRLCYEMYVQGDRPFCVSSIKYSKDCIFDLESVTDIPKIYAETIKDYPALPKVCNVFGVPKPVLAA